LELRTRRFAFDLDGASYINIDGLNLVASTINLQNGSHCDISNCNIQYPTPYFLPDGQNHSEETWGVVLSGSQNTIENCVVAHSWGDGISMDGSDNTVKNCLIYDVDKAGVYCANVYCQGSDHHVQGNTLKNSGRFCINHQYATNATISYNDISYALLLTCDGGAVYSYLTNGAEISYNWIHDNLGVSGKGHAIYGDGGPSNFNIHHNVIYNGGSIYPHGIPTAASNIKVDFNTIIPQNLALYFHEGSYFNAEYSHNVICGSVSIDINSSSQYPIDNGNLSINGNIPGNLEAYIPNWKYCNFHLAAPYSSSGCGAYADNDHWKAGCTLNVKGEPYRWYWFPGMYYSD